VTVKMTPRGRPLMIMARRPTADGIDGRLVEQGNRAQDLDILYPPVDVGRSLDDDDAFDASLAGDSG